MRCTCGALTHCRLLTTRPVCHGRGAGGQCGQIAHLGRVQDAAARNDLRHICHPGLLSQHRLAIPYPACWYVCCCLHIEKDDSNNSNNKMVVTTHRWRAGDDFGSHGGY